MVHFTANTVVVDDSNEDYIIVAFARELRGKYREAFHFQRSHIFDEQDVALGMDSVYIERNDQMQGGYRGIERVELHRDRIRVLIRGAVAKRMKTSEVQIAFDLPAAEFERLRLGLRTVFAGFDSLFETPAS